MMATSSTSNRNPINEGSQQYPYPLHVNAASFLSIKLLGEPNYVRWRKQMTCLLDSHDMLGFVDGSLRRPETNMADFDAKYREWKRSDTLVKGWIFGSLSEDVMEIVVGLETASDVWNTLQGEFSITYPASPTPPVTAREEDSTLKNYETQTDDQEGANSIEHTNVASPETNTFVEGAISVEIEGGEDTRETQTRDEDMQKKKEMIENKKEICKATIKGNWSKVKSILDKNKDLEKEAISGDGSTILHFAVGTGQNDIVKRLILRFSDEDVLIKRASDGSTSLHIAAIVGNKDAAELLVKKNRNLLLIKDGNDKEPLHKAYENMHLFTIGYLLQAISDDAKTESQSSSPHPSEKIAVDQVLVNAIYAKQYSFASKLVRDFPKFASKSDDVLMAIAKTFPRGLDYGEALIYASGGLTVGMVNIADWIMDLFYIPFDTIDLYYEKVFGITNNVIYNALITVLILTVPIMLLLAYCFVYIIIILVCYMISFLYIIWWKVATRLVAPIKHIDDKQKEWDEAEKLLELVCDEIDKEKDGGSQHSYYTQPVLEAACHNAYQVVDEILFRSPETIDSTDTSGYDIIHLAIINRSEKIYNLIYDIGERKNLYRTYRDSSQNNILHLAGKLAPAGVLNKITGAALQLQRELQWREEVKKFVFPTYITQENKFKETPDMLFTREHLDLVKEGEKWMKTTAESSSITAALITTIVFAAAITVPGGSNQEKGTPLFKNKIPFIIFAISDAISLFASSTALLVFLSILTARFAEKDFLVSLPRRLFIGLFALILSTTAMMVAFSATLFLVFCDEQLWMLAPICGLAFIPIAFFVGLQFPLMVDLFRSTYIGIFGKEKKSIPRRFNPDEIRLRFGKRI